MLNRSSVGTFVKALREQPQRKSADGDWFWIVGTGVTAAVTGNTREATWLGLVRTAVEHVAASVERPGEVIRRLASDGVDNWHPNSPELWGVVQMVAEYLGDSVDRNRWIVQRMRYLEANVKDDRLVQAIGRFDWPVATTNYDNVLADRLHRDYRLLVDISEHEVENWRRGSHPAILHLHGHSARGDLLFTKEDYATYTGPDSFRQRMGALFRGRPVFIGCKDTLADPNISKALTYQFRTHQNYSRDPLVLLRSTEQLNLSFQVQPIHYGEHYDELIPFLTAAWEELRGVAPLLIVNMTQDSRGNIKSQVPSWLGIFFTGLARDFKSLRLPDFRVADRDIALPLDDIYLALTFDPRTAQERLEESRALHHSGRPAEQLAVDPYPRSIGSALPCSGRVTLAEVLSRHPFAVILGDPGAGKTTLTHWLVRQCAIARLHERADVVVEALRLDSEAKPDTDPQIVGPAWFPVVISIPDYVLERMNLGVDRRRRLVRFTATLVRKRLEKEDIHIAVDEAEEWLAVEAASGRLLLLLDGLDESVHDEERRDIVEETEALVDWVFLPSSGENLPKAPPLRNRNSNRVLITSRIAGYKYAPFSIDIPHYRIEPLTLPGATRLLSNLFTALESVQPNSEEALAPNLTTLREGLMARLEIGGPSGLASLASNPVLASALFSLHVARAGLLPADRFGLYQGVIDLFMRREAQRLRPTEDVKWAAAGLRQIFQDLAYEAFSSPDSALIKEERLRNKLVDWSVVTEANASAYFDTKGIAFGPLVPKMPGAYGFIHRTFQEYLCAEYLTRRGQSFARVVDLAGLPSWTEPSRLAFMIWSSRPATLSSRAADILMLREGSFLGNAFRPLALAVAAVAEVTETDRMLCELLVDATIDVLANSLPNWKVTPNDLTSALSLLRQKEEGALAIDEGLEAAVRAILTDSEAQLVGERAAVAARLIESLELFSPVLVEALQAAHRYDQETLDWPITSALLRATTPDLASGTQLQDWIALDTNFLGRAGQQYASAEAVTYLERHPEDIQRLLRSSGWVRLLTALLGGQRDYRLGESIASYAAIVGFLQLTANRRESMLPSLPVQWQSTAKAMRKDANDPDLVYELAAYLDTKGGEAVRRASHIPPSFRLSTCVFPVHGWQAIREHLAASPATAAAEFPLLQAVVMPVPPKFTPANRVEARNLQYRIADAARRTLRCFSQEQAIAVLGRVPQEYHSMLIDSLAAVGSHLGEPDPLQAFSDVNSLKSIVISRAAAAIIRHERLSSQCSLFSDNRQYAAADWLDKRITGEYFRLADICRAHSQNSGGRSDMPHLPPPYLGAAKEAHILDDLTALERFPLSLTFLAETIMSELAISSDTRAAIPELAAILNRLPWTYYDLKTLEGQLGFNPRTNIESLNQLIRNAPMPWSLRARIRLLASLSAEKRKVEERAIQSALRNLPGGLLSVQCIELLAERTSYLEVPSLIEAALAVPGLTPVDAACLRLRLLPLVAVGAHRFSILQEALSISESIPDEMERATVLHLTSRYRTIVPETDFCISEASLQIRDPVRRAYARGLPGAVLSALADDILSGDMFFGGEAVAPLIVYAKLNDALITTTDHVAESIGYSDLLHAVEWTGATGNKEIIASAIATATISSPRGLPAACRAALVNLRGTDFADQLAAITLAAHEGLGPQTVEGVVAALASEHDEVRARAQSLLLPDVKVESDGKAIGLSAAGCGLETLIQLGKSRLTCGLAGSALLIGWRLENTVLDSAELAQALCDIGNGNGNLSDAARTVISSFKQLTPEVKSVLVERVQICSPDLRYSLRKLFARSMYFQDIGEEISDAIFGSDLECSPNPALILITPDEIVSHLNATYDPPQIMCNMTKAHGRSFSSFFNYPDNKSFELLRELGATSFTRSSGNEEKDVEIARAADLLLAIEDGPIRAVGLLAYLIASDVRDPQPGTFLRSTLMTILAAAAERSPARTIAPFESPAMRSMVAKVAISSNSFPARRAAFLLIGHILDKPDRPPSPEEVAALISVVTDVPPVIDAALATASRIRSLSQRGLGKLCETLRGSSAARAALVGRMLINIARNKVATHEVRSAIFGDISAFIADPRSNRRIYFSVLDAATPPAPTIREQLLEELAASGGGVAQMN